MLWIEDSRKKHLIGNGSLLRDINRLFVPATSMANQRHTVLAPIKEGITITRIEWGKCRKAIRTGEEDNAIERIDRDKA